MARKITINDEHLAILRSAMIEGNNLRLTAQLDRATYTTINKVLEAAGGKWNRKAAAHVFSTEDIETIKSLVSGDAQTVEKKANEQQVRQAYYTPPVVAEMVAKHVQRRLGDLQGLMILEPEAGDGALVRPLMSRGARVHAYDICEAELAKSGAESWEVRDFLEVRPGFLYDAVVMNPPFTKGQDAKHVLHALEFVRPDHHVFAILPPMWRKKSTGPYKALNTRPYEVLEEIPAKTFEDTDVATELVMFTRSA